MTTWFCVQYNDNPSDRYGWADTYHGDHLDTLEAAQHFAAHWDLPSTTRIVKRTEEPVDTSDPTSADHASNMARLVRDAATALGRVNAYWEERGLPGDFSTPETGYPFAMSLDEQVHAVHEWADRLESAA